MYVWKSLFFPSMNLGIPLYVEVESSLEEHGYSQATEVQTMH